MSVLLGDGLCPFQGKDVCLGDTLSKQKMVFYLDPSFVPTAFCHHCSNMDYQSCLNFQVDVYICADLLELGNFDISCCVLSQTGFV